MVRCIPVKKALKSLLVLWVTLAAYSCVGLLELERDNPNDPNAKNYQPTGATTDNNSNNDTAPPSAPSSLSATVLSDTEIRLTWQAASDNETAANEIVYEACYSESFNGCDSFNSLKSVTGGVLTLDLTSLQSNTNYFIKLRAKDAAGNTSSAVSTTGQTQVTGSVGGVVFSVAGGQYNSDQTLSLSSSTTGATICYTTGASPADPTCSNGSCTGGSTYSTALTINSDQTVKAMACKAGLIDAGVNSETYTIRYSYDVTFNANGGTGSMNAQSIVQDETANLTSNTFSRSGYLFLGWATVNSATTATYADGASYTMGSSGVILYAVWKKLWEQIAFIKASNRGTDDEFGSSIAMNSQYLVVGAPKEASDQNNVANSLSELSDNNNANRAGAVYVYKYENGGYTFDAYLKPFNPTIGDYFGTSVAISGNYIAVGAPYEDGSGSSIITTGFNANDDKSNSGAVYIFFNNAGNWELHSYIKAPNSGNGDEFGFDVGFQANYLLTGAAEEDNSQTTITNGTPISETATKDGSGALYLYELQSNTFAFKTYIKRPEISGGPFDDSDNLGVTLAIYDQNIVAGTLLEGVYFLKKNGVNWEQVQYFDWDTIPNAGSLYGSKFASHDIYTYSSESNSWTLEYNTNKDFSSSALSSNIFIGSTTEQKIFIYDFDSTWNLSQEITGSFVESNDRFGSDLALVGNLIAVGTKWDDSDTNSIITDTSIAQNNLSSDSGAVYIFAK